MSTKTGNVKERYYEAEEDGIGKLLEVTLDRAIELLKYSFPKAGLVVLIIAYLFENDPQYYSFIATAVLASLVVDWMDLLIHFPVLAGKIIVKGLLDRYSEHTSIFAMLYILLLIALAISGLFAWFETDGNVLSRLSPTALFALVFADAIRRAIERIRDE